MRLLWAVVLFSCAAPAGIGAAMMFGVTGWLLGGMMES